MSVYDKIAGLFEKFGRNAYHGEPVSQAEHAFQSGHLAETAGASDALIISALLHDIGHFLEEIPEDLAERGIDACHELVGSVYLESTFGPDVAEPARLHVDAKRYLCATEPAYFERLSPASVLSLKLQGGALSGEELDRFRANRYCDDAVKLRKWDDDAKIPGLEVPGIEHYRGRIEALARKRDEGRS